jgi:hypothetical protein
VYQPGVRGTIGTMPRVELTATGRGIGASGEEDAFADLVRTEIAHVAPAARPTILVGADDAVTVSMELDRADQAAVGDVLERLLREVKIESAVLEAPPQSDG